MGATTEPGMTAHRSIQDVLTQVPSAVTVLTCTRHDGGIAGTIVNGMVTLGPSSALLLVVPNDSAVSGDLRLHESCWVSILADDQGDLLASFAEAGTEADLWESDVDWQSPNGHRAVPGGVLAWIEGTIVEVTPARDSLLVHVVATAARLERDTHPLISFQGGYGGFHPTTITASHEAGMEGPLRVARLAQGSIQLVASEIGAECSVIGYDRGDQVALNVANYSSTARGTQIGERFPIVPPVGILFVDSPHTDLDQERWLSRIELAGSGDHSQWRAQALQQLARVKRRGWSIMVGGPYASRELDDLTGSAGERPADERSRVLVDSVRAMAASHEPERIEDDETYDVHALTVPVQTEPGHTIVTLRLIGLPPHATGREIKFWLSLLQQAAGTVKGLYELDRRNRQ